MSKLIKVNSQNSSIKSITLGCVRLTAFEDSSDYKIRVSVFSDGVYFLQETYVSPCQLEHVADRDSDGKVWTFLRDTDYGIDLYIDCKHTYIAVCELFSMPLNDDVIRAFESEA